MKTVYLVEFVGSWNYMGKRRTLRQTKLVLTRKAAERTRFKWNFARASAIKTITEFKRWRKIPPNA
jgi:hypothetical protein